MYESNDPTQVPLIQLALRHLCHICCWVVDAADNGSDWSVLFVHLRVCLYLSMLWVVWEHVFADLVIDASSPVQVLHQFLYLVGQGLQCVLRELFLGCIVCKVISHFVHIVLPVQDHNPRTLVRWPDDN